MFKPATIKLLKEQLKTTSQQDLINICLRLAKYKVENKELISYLLFESDDEIYFLNSVKEEMSEQFSSINDQSAYLAKKTLRKVIRTATKYIRFVSSKQFEAEVWMYFLLLIKSYPDLLSSNKVIQNMKIRAIAKINKAIKYLHEDLQYDYKQELIDLI